MFEERVEIQTPDGVCDAHFYAPSKDGAYPGVLYYPDGIGSRPAFEAMAKRLAANGYAVLLPNLYYRASPAPQYTAVPNFQDEAVRGPLMALIGSMTPERMRSDAAAYADYLLERRQTRPGKLGVAGYCMSGGMAVRTAAALPDAIAAAASFHGGRLVNDDPESPHRLAPQLKARLYFGFAVNDQGMTPEQIETLKAALDKAGVRYEGEVYDGALHGWAVDDMPVYNDPQAEHHWEKLLQLFKETL